MKNKQTFAISMSKFVLSTATILFLSSGAHATEFAEKTPGSDLGKGKSRVRLASEDTLSLSSAHSSGGASSSGSSVETLHIKAKAVAEAALSGDKNSLAEQCRSVEQFLANMASMDREGLEAYLMDVH